MLKIEALTFWGRETGHHMWFVNPKRLKRVTRLRIGQTYCDITRHGMTLFTVGHGQRDIPFRPDGANKRWTKGRGITMTVRAARLPDPCAFLICVHVCHFCFYIQTSNHCDFRLGRSITFLPRWGEQKVDKREGDHDDGASCEAP